MERKIAIEGLKEDIVQVVCKIVQISKDNTICFSNESNFIKLNSMQVLLREEPNDIVNNILHYNPNLTIFCNARGYLEVIKKYSSLLKSPPMVVLTGGGPNMVDQVYQIKRIEDKVIEVPLRIEYLLNTIDSFFLEENKN